MPIDYTFPLTDADEGQAYFDATDPGKANPTLSDTCNMYRNSGIPLRRSCKLSN